MRKDPHQRTLDPLKIRKDYGLTFDHLTYEAISHEDIARFVAARRQAIVDLLKCPPSDEQQRQAIMLRAREEWAQTKATDLDDIAALASDLDTLLVRVLTDLRAEQPTPELDRLLEPAAQQERSFRFEGALQEILFRYRDIGQRLTEADHARALKLLQQGQEKIQEGFNLLAQYAFDELSFSDRHWAMHVEIVTQLGAMVQRYNKVYNNNLGSISGRDDDDKVWREFMVACSLACLRHYGLAPNWAVHQLLARKSDGYEYQMGCVQWPKSDQDAVKRRVNDLSAQARQRAIKLAELENWYTRPVIEFTSAAKWVRIINQRPTTKEDEVNIESAADKTASGSESVAQFDLQAIWNQSPN